MRELSLFSPAKINLFLAITGRREDGFHDLVSVVVPISFGDDLRIECSEKPDTNGSPFTLTCSDATVPVDETNLILRAARAFRAETGWTGGAHFSLQKRIPMGAGLGGGSSNATAVIRGLNEVAGHPLGDTQMSTLASRIGSDCALFLHHGPVVMRGRGEQIEPLVSMSPAATRRLSGRRLVLFKPDIGINTAWAYRQLAAKAPGSYLPAQEAEARLAAWCGGEGEAGRAEALLFNNMEPPAFDKFLALPVLLAQLRKEFDVVAGMSGSGSACFALLDERRPEKHHFEAIASRIKEALGKDSFVVETQIL